MPSKKETTSSRVRLFLSTGTIVIIYYKDVDYSAIRQSLDESLAMRTSFLVCNWIPEQVVFKSGDGIVLFNGGVSEAEEISEIDSGKIIAWTIEETT